MNLDHWTILALALFGIGVYLRMLVLHDRCRNLEAMQRDLEADNERLRQSNRRHVLETTRMSLAVQQLYGQAQLERAQRDNGVPVPVLWGNN